ncbi:hypothetical protein L208DRAFT_919511 [Tricholoma matsutake]|nr:hypothetical protein L208DRAFT_919511 [Tricholoma matsutake 945]
MSEHIAPPRQVHRLTGGADMTNSPLLDHSRSTLRSRHLSLHTLLLSLVCILGMGRRHNSHSSNWGRHRDLMHLSSSSHSRDKGSRRGMRRRMQGCHMEHRGRRPILHRCKDRHRHQFSKSSLGHRKSSLSLSSSNPSSNPSSSNLSSSNLSRCNLSLSHSHSHSRPNPSLRSSPNRVYKPNLRCMRRLLLLKNKPNLSRHQRKCMHSSSLGLPSQSISSHKQARRTSSTPTPRTRTRMSRRGRSTMRKVDRTRSEQCISFQSQVLQRMPPLMEVEVAVRRRIVHSHSRLRLRSRTLAWMQEAECPRMHRKRVCHLIASAYRTLAMHLQAHMYNLLRLVIMLVMQSLLPITLIRVSNAMPSPSFRIHSLSRDRVLAWWIPFRVRVLVLAQA